MTWLKGRIVDMKNNAMDIRHIGNPAGKEAKKVAGDMKCLLGQLGWVGKQKVGELMRVSKLTMRIYTVRTNADHMSTGCLKLMIAVAEATGLTCASGSVVFWVKKYDKGIFADKIMQSYGLAVLIG